MNPDPASTETHAEAQARWVLVFVAEPGAVPAGRRVAQLLRYAKRRQGFKCIEVSERTPDEQRDRLRDEVAELRTALAKAERGARRKVLA